MSMSRTEARQRLDRRRGRQQVRRRAAGQLGRPVDVDGVLTGRATFAVPDQLPLGWHTLRGGQRGQWPECPLIVTPRRLHTTGRSRGRRNWGLTAQLYSVRSSRSWGIGDFTDLADLAAMTGQEGAGFVLVNPAARGRARPPVEDSPYLPTTRRFFNPLYLRVEEIPEYGYLDPAGRAEVERLAEQLHTANHSSRAAGPERQLQGQTGRPGADVRGPRGTPPARSAVCGLLRRQGQGLDDFALWCALAEKLPPIAPQWAAEAASPGNAVLPGATDALAGRIEFHRWLQWLCDQQLESAQRSASRAGMEIGVIHDLAVGVKTGRRGRLDPVGGTGPGRHGGCAAGHVQPAGPELDPAAVASGPAGRVRLCRLPGHAPDGAPPCRRDPGGPHPGPVPAVVDPGGAGPGEGTYVYYDHEALIGILALEAQRAGAIVIGEDLGVFEPWVRDYLAERGIFGTSILWFEHDADGPIPPERYRQQCLTSVNTHDLPPTAGYLAGEHVTLRESLGLLQRPVRRGTRRGSRGAGSRAGARPRSRPPAGAPGAADVQRTVEALYAFTALTPSSLLGVALVDAVGETRTQNQPGTSTEYPNWRIPLAGPRGPVLLDGLVRIRGFRSLVGTDPDSTAPGLRQAQGKGILPPNQ